MFHKKRNTHGLLIAAAIAFLTIAHSGCAQIRLPAIDPTGNRIFLPAPNSTTLLTPNLVRNQNNPLRNQIGIGNAPQAVAPIPRFDSTPSYPAVPAFQHPADPVPCVQPNRQQAKKKIHVIPASSALKSRGQRGQIIMTPSRIVAPVGSEVVVLAGICGADGYYVMNQPLEWMLSNDSVGQFVEVGGMDHSTFNHLVPPSARKFDGQYAWGRTGFKERLLTRGTPTPVDDIHLLKGQAFVSVSSASPGTSYITGVAPNADAWDQRRESTIIHWVDALWSIPVPAAATAGTVYPLTTQITRSTDGGGVKDWTVRYEILSGAPAEFAPTGSQTAEVKTGSDGQAVVQIRQAAGQFQPGTTQVRVDVVRPPLFGEQELVLESGVTSVTWSAPALTIKAIGPKSAGPDESFNYRLEITNPGDQPARNVAVRTKDLDESVEFISSTPKPVEYGRQYEWRLGDIVPGAPAQIIDVQLKSKKRGNVGLCFEVLSETDGLKTEACAQTEIAVPCIGLEIDGPAQARVGDEIEYRLKIVNQCDDPLENIEFLVNYDNGLQAMGLGNPVRYRIDKLEFGQERIVPLKFRVVQPGTRCFDMSVTADGGHTSRSRQCVEASQFGDSSLTIDLASRGVTQVGDVVLVRADIRNSGNQPLENVVATVRFSPSLKVNRLTSGLNDRFLGNELLGLNVGRLEAGQNKIVEIEFLGDQQDNEAFAEMAVTTVGTEADTKRVQIQVVPPGQNPQGGAVQPPAAEPPIGIPGGAAAVPRQGQLEVQVRSLNRTAPRNGDATFEFSVRNNSNVPHDNVDITLLIPPGLTYKQMDFQKYGAGLPIVSKNADLTELYLQRRQTLRVDEELRFEITFTSNQLGNATFEVSAKSDNISLPVQSRDTVTIIE